MARYQLPQPQSMYRDTGLVENTKLFRQRYVQNMAADDALAQSVLEMDSMEEDQEAKAALVEKYNAQLKQRSESGNYHMLGSAIQKDARSFINEYQPIKVSKARYDSWLGNLQKMYDKGDINSETYNLKRSEAKYNYKGIKKNADGSTDETSLFVGPGYVKDVNVPELLDTRMKGLVMQELEKEGEIPLNSDMSKFELIAGTNPDTQSPAYYLTNGSVEKWVDGNKVQTIVNTVLNEADVKKSIEQQAHLQNFTKGESSDGGGDISIATKEIDDKILNLETIIDKLEGKKKLSKTEEQELKGATALLEHIEDARNIGTDDLSLRTALSAHTIKGQYMDYAITKYAGVQSQKYTTKLTEGSRFTQNLKTTSSYLPTIKYNVGAKGLIVEPLGGNTVNSKKEKYEESIAAIDKYRTPNSPEYKGGLILGNEFGRKDEELTFVEASLLATTAEHYDAIAKQYKISNAEARRIAKEIQYNQRTAELIDLKLEEAFISEHKMSSEDYGNMIANNASNLDASYDGINYLEDQQFTLNMNSIQSAFEQLGKSGLGPGEMIKQLNDDKQLKNQVVKIIATQNMNSADMSQVDPAVLEIPELRSEIQNDFTQETNQGISNMINSQMSLVNDGQDKINKFLKDEEIKTDAVVMTSFNDTSGKTRKAVQDFFSAGVPNTADFQLIDENGNPTTYAELVENDDFWSMQLGKRKPPTNV